MDVKLTVLPLIYGVAGAREKFEDLAVQLVRCERPDAERIRLVVGDGGIDAHDGSLSDPSGVDVFQVKYFPSGIAAAQQNQIRKSFRTVATSTEFKTRSWILCLPIDLSVDEKKWFEKWKGKKEKEAGITIPPPWGATKLESLLYDPKNSAIKNAFFRQEDLELLRQQVSQLERIFQEFVARVPTPVVPLLRATLDGARSRNAYRSTENKIVVELQLCFRIHNDGPKAVQSWDCGCGLTWDSSEPPDRILSRQQFPQLGTGASYYRLDKTILPTLSLTTEHIFGIAIRRSEPFDETLQRVIDRTIATFWPISEDGPGEKSTVRLAEIMNWPEQLDGFKQAHAQVLGRLSAE